MPLNRKWRSMDFFGSHESLNKATLPQASKSDRSHSVQGKVVHHHHFPVRKMFRNRLGSRDTPGSGEVEPPSPDPSARTQKCIIIQRDDKGYGFTVSGDNPVYVGSVKQDGAAARAGVQNGDRIIKVNGTLVTQRNHLDVVKLIKSGHYVALTLLGRPTPTTPSSPVTNASTRGDPVVPELVTSPQPVDHDKDKELWQQKVIMTRAMYETAKEDFEKLQKLYVSRPSEKLHTQLLDQERTVKTLDNKLKQLTGGQDTASVNIPAEPIVGEHSTVQSGAPSLTITHTSDLGSMSDTSPSVSPTPQHIYRHNGQDLEDSLIGATDIIHIDDEEINSEDDQVNDPGMFADMRLLENKPAHLAVLLNYLISNSDPSPVLFHIISDLYQRSAANVKELRKWAYEIFSTFVFKLAPLSISVEDSLISQMDNILTSSGSRTDNENVLRAMFQAPRQSVQMEIADLLMDFRSKKDLGMGNLYGIQKVQDNMDRLSEVRVAEELLIPHLKFLCAEDGSRVDKDLAMGWALATFLRSLGAPKSLHTAALDRVQTFMVKDKKSGIFPSRSSKAKAVRGHQLSLHHFYVTTFCSFCGKLVWGVGYQGYQCQSCDMILHKWCADEIIEQCAGKQKKRISTRLPGAIQSLRSSSTSLGQQPVHVSQTSEPVSVSQPYPRQEDSQLGATLSIIAGLPSGHSVQSIVKRYQTMSSPTEPGPPSLAVPDQPKVNNSAKKDRRGSSDLNRSGSLNNKEEKVDKPTRRANSDVRVDADTFKAINQSGSSSASSLSNRSAESPANSTDNVHDLLRAQNEDPDLDVEPELPPLKQVLPEDVLRKLKPKEKRRQEVINELFYTERAHLRNLKVLDLLFYRPMAQEKGMMVDLARALFPNMQEMISLHVTFVQDMKDRSQATPVVKDVGDLLLTRFDGEAGERFRKGCAEYCRNQAFALDALKKQTRKEPKLQQFLHDAESNSLCRRLQLKDLVPSQMQRLTKYPLLIDNLLKYTLPQSEEYKRLERAHERCKHILVYVNQAIKECENYHKLKDIQKKLDRRSVEGLNDPALADLKTLDLTKHKLIFDGPLTWKLRTHRLLDMHVLLFEGMLVLLQKQDDKFVLKCQNTNAQLTARDDKYTHYPILKLQNLLARTLATEKRSFFVVNISESRAQMYEFTAASCELRLKWCKFINDKADEFKKASKLPHLSNDFGRVSQMEPVTIDRNRLSRVSRRVRSSAAVADQTSSPAEDIYEMTDQLRDDLDSSDSQMELITPEEVNVSVPVFIQSTTVSSTLELLCLNGEKVEAALDERGRILAQLRKLSYDQYLAITTQQVCPLSRQEEDESQGGYSTSSEYLVAKAMDLNGTYIKCISDASSHVVQDDACSFHSTSSPSVRPADPCQDHIGSRPQHINVSVPLEQFKSIGTEMNVILAKLADAVHCGSEERLHLRQELEKAQQSLDNIKRQQKHLSETASSGGPVLSSPVSEWIDILNVSHSPATTTATDMDQVLAASSALSLLQQQERDMLCRKYGLEDETPDEAEMSALQVHHGIQEATVSQLEESVQPLSLSSSPADLLPVVAIETRAGLRGTSLVIDDDEDNEVSVADLPLPDLISSGADDILSAPAHYVDGESGADDDTLTLKTSYQDFSSLTTTLEDIVGEEREVGGEEREVGGEERQVGGEKIEVADQVSSFTENQTLEVDGGEDGDEARGPSCGDVDTFDGGVSVDVDTFDGGVSVDVDTFDGGVSVDVDTFDGGVSVDVDTFDGGVSVDVDTFDGGVGDL